MEVAIDQTLCRGDCICELICPAVFVLDEGGIARVVQDGQMRTGPEGWAAVPPGAEVQVLDAVKECPSGAIAVRAEQMAAG